jgi:hypothetical protein
MHLTKAINDRKADEFIGSEMIEFEIEIEIEALTIVIENEFCSKTR